MENTQSIEPNGPVVKMVESPDGNLAAKAYINDSGATTNYAVLVQIINHKTKRVRNVFWDYPSDKVNLSWKNNNLIVVNGMELNAKTDVYDWRTTDHETMYVNIIFIMIGAIITGILLIIDKRKRKEKP